MTNEELIQKFNPAAAGKLTNDDLAILRGLTVDQIGVLAKAYPNEATNKPYLLLHDSGVKDDKQLYPLSTWQNLYNLYKYHGKKNFTAYTFKALFVKSNKTPSLPGLRSAPAATGKVIDLSSTEAAALLRENFGASDQPPAPPAANPKLKAAPQKPAAKANPKAPVAKGKTVDVGGKTKAGKGTAPEADDEDLQDFSEAE